MRSHKNSKSFSIRPNEAADETRDVTTRLNSPTYMRQSVGSPSKTFRKRRESNIQKQLAQKKGESN